jgi:hypothetical protein
MLSILSAFFLTNHAVNLLYSIVTADAVKFLLVTNLVKKPVLVQNKVFLINKRDTVVKGMKNQQKITIIVMMPVNLKELNTE